MSGPAMMTAAQSNHQQSNPTTNVYHQGSLPSDSEDGADDNHSAEVPPASRGGEITSLLHFVKVASSDIRAALDKSAPCKRSVDHRKYLQKQLKKRFSRSPSPGALLPTRADLRPKINTSINSQLGFPEVCPGACQSSWTSAQLSETCRTEEQSVGDIRGGAKRKLIEHQNINPHPQTVELEWRQAVVANHRATPSDPSDLHGESITMSSSQDLSQSFSQQTNTNVDSLFERAGIFFKDKRAAPDENRVDADDDKQVPLRQRQLPASFWQEPNVPKSAAEHDSYLLYKYGLNINHVLHNEFWQYAYGTNLAMPYGMTSGENQTAPSRSDYFYPSVPSKYQTDPQAFAYPYPLSYGGTLDPAFRTSGGLSSSSSSSTPYYRNLPYRAALYSSPSSALSSLTRERHMASSRASAAVAAAAGLLDRSQRPHIWKPIPTKTGNHNLHTRYHPFADVR